MTTKVKSGELCEWRRWIDEDERTGEMRQSEKARSVGLVIRQAVNLLFGSPAAGQMSQACVTNSCRFSAVPSPKLRVSNFTDGPRLIYLRNKSSV